MTEPTSLIVYRNPLEYYLWNSGILFPVITGMVLAVISVSLVDKAGRKLLPWRSYNKNSGIIATIAASVTMGLTLWVML